MNHESTKIRKHERVNIVLFRAFNLSCFRDCVLEFSATKYTKINIKILTDTTKHKNEIAFTDIL